MKKKLIPPLGGLLLFLCFKIAKQLPCVGGLFAALEAIVVLATLGYLLYALVRLLYLWYKTK